VSTWGTCLYTNTHTQLTTIKYLPMSGCDTNVMLMTPNGVNSV